MVSELAPLSVFGSSKLSVTTTVTVPTAPPILLTKALWPFAVNVTVSGAADTKLMSNNENSANSVRPSPASLNLLIIAHPPESVSPVDYHAVESQPVASRLLYNL